MFDAKGAQDNLSGSAQADLVMITYGRMAGVCLEAAKQLQEQGICATVVGLERIHPVDFDELIPLLSKKALFVEEGIETGGIGQQVLLRLLQLGVCRAVDLVAVRDRFVPHGTAQELLSLCGLDATGIAARATALLQRGEGHE